jgi:hypothetical protein
MYFRKDLGHQECASGSRLELRLLCYYSRGSAQSESFLPRSSRLKRLVFRAPLRAPRRSFAGGFVSHDNFVPPFSEYDGCLVAIHGAVERGGFLLERSG